MKIAFLVNEFPVLSETFILNQITGLLDLGHEVEIFAQSHPGQAMVHRDVEKYNLMERVHYLPKVPKNKIIRRFKALLITMIYLLWFPVKTFKGLRILLSRKEGFSYELLYLIFYFLPKKFDIIQCHYGFIGVNGTYLKEVGIKTRLVTMFHGYDIRTGLEKGGAIYRRLFKFGDCFLSISQYNYRNLVDMGADAGKIVYHPVGIDLGKFTYKWDRPVSFSAATIIIITVARLVEEKGLEYGIEAIAQLHNKYPAIKLTYNIIGTGPLEKKLRELTNKANLNGVVFFLGPLSQEEIGRKLQEAQIFLLPSVAEALPVVLMEAQASGLPIVATNVGSIDELVIDGKSGFLVPDKNANALAEKIDYLIEHPEIWPQMGRSGRDYVEKHFAITLLNQRLVKIYQDLIKK